MRRLVLSAALVTLLVPAWAEPAMTFTPETVTIEDGGRTVLRYRYEGVPFKPYVDVLTTPSGINILRDAPHDHLHHHALMFAIKIDDVNYWEEAQAPGVQKHTMFSRANLLAANGTARAYFEDSIRWLPAPDAERTAVLERRMIQEHGVVHEAQLVTWTTEFIAVSPAVLGGAHYHGLGMRFVESMDKVGEFRFAGGAEGEVVRGTEKLTPGNWVAYTAPIDGKVVTVVMFDHPDNARPVLWFTMLDPFSYLSATINLHREPLALNPVPVEPARAGQSTAVVQAHRMHLTYGIAAWDGRPEDAEIQAMFDAWLKLTSPDTEMRAGS